MAVAVRTQSPLVERVASWLAGIGHEPGPATAMAANLLGESIADPRLARRYASLTMTPDERHRFADALNARRVLLEGTLLSLGGREVREGSVLAAHALCEARGARRPISLRLGGAVAHADQVSAARSRLVTEIESIDRLVEAAVEDGETLKQGVGGAKPHPRVVHLQNRLNMLGHRVAADGRFGPVTAEAVKDFQAKAGMQPTGEVDEDTRNALRHGRKVVELQPVVTTGQPVGDVQVDAEGKAGDGQPQQPQLQAVPAPPGLGAGVGTDPVPDVQELQKGLNAAGHPVAQDGRFGPTTAAALKRFQRSHGLPVTGVADDRTRRALKDLQETQEDAMSEVQETLTACPTCGGPMRSSGVCQRGHRIKGSGKMPTPPVRHKNVGPIQETGCKDCGDAKIELTEAAVADLDTVTVEEALSELDSMDRAVLRLALREAKDSMMKASTPEPFSSSRTSNWVARVGGLPAYVQHIAHDLMEKRGKDESGAIRMAIGIVKRWCRGGGNVDANTKAAACKATAEWAAKRAASHAKSAAKGAAHALAAAYIAESKVRFDPDNDGDVDIDGKTDDEDMPEGEDALNAPPTKLKEAESKADYPQTMACPTCGARASAHAKACPRGHRLYEAVDLLATLQETWEAFDEQRHNAHWGKLVKAGPLPGAPHKDSPGRGPSGKLRNFDSMAGPKLAATLEALAVHGEDPEAHQAAMYAAGKKLGMKIHVPREQPKPVRTLLDECDCGAPVRNGVCQRGHRIQEAWSPEARAAAALAHKKHHSDAAVAAGATHAHLSPVKSGPWVDGEAGRNWVVKGYVKPDGVAMAQKTASIGDRIEPISKFKANYSHASEHTFRTRRPA